MLLKSRHMKSASVLLYAGLFATSGLWGGDIQERVTTCINKMKKGDRSGLVQAQYSEDPGKAATLFSSFVLSIPESERREELVRFAKSLEKQAIGTAGKSSLSSNEDLAKQLASILAQDSSPHVRRCAAEAMLALFSEADLAKYPSQITKAVEEGPVEPCVLALYGVLPGVTLSDIRRRGDGADLSWSVLYEAVLVRHGDTEAQQKMLRRIEGTQATTYSEMEHLSEALAYSNSKEIARFLCGGLGREDKIPLSLGYIPRAVFYARLLVGMNKNNGSFPFKDLWDDDPLKGPRLDEVRAWCQSQGLSNAPSAVVGME